MLELAKKYRLEYLKNPKVQFTAPVAAGRPQPRYPQFA